MQGLLALGRHEAAIFTEEVTTVRLPELSQQASGVLIQAIGGDCRFVLDGETDPAESGFMLRGDAEPILLGYIPTMTHVTVCGQPGSIIAWQAVRRI